MLLSINSWEVFKCTVYNLQEYVNLNNQCYFFSSVCKHIEVVNFHIRNFDNIEVVSFHKFMIYWNSKTTSRCRNLCVFYGTWLWIVKNVSDMNDPTFFVAWRILRHKLWKYPQKRHPHVVPMSYSHHTWTQKSFAANSNQKHDSSNNRIHGEREQNGSKLYSWNLFLLHRILYFKTHYFLLSFDLIFTNNSLFKYALCTF